MAISFDTTYKRIVLTPETGKGDSWANAYTFKDIADYFASNPISNWYDPTSGDVIEDSDTSYWSVVEGSGTIAVESTIVNTGSYSINITKSDANQVRVTRDLGAYNYWTSNEETLESSEFLRFYVRADQDGVTIDKVRIYFWSEGRWATYDGPWDVPNGSWTEIKIDLRNDINYDDSYLRSRGFMYGVPRVDWWISGPSGANIYLDTMAFGRENHTVSYDNGLFISNYAIYLDSGVYFLTEKEIFYCTKLNGGEFKFGSDFHFRAGTSIEGIPLKGSTFIVSPMADNSGGYFARWSISGGEFLMYNSRLQLMEDEDAPARKRGIWYPFYPSSGMINSLSTSEATGFFVNGNPNNYVGLKNFVDKSMQLTLWYGTGWAVPPAKFEDCEVGYVTMRNKANALGYSTNNVLYRFKMHHEIVHLNFNWVIYTPVIAVCEDCEFDNDKVRMNFPSGYGTRNLQLWRVNTVKIKVVDENGDPIQGAKVTIENKDGVISNPETETTLENIETDANGEINEKVIVRLWDITYDDAGSGGYVYPTGEDQNPFTITIKKSGYETYQAKVTIDSPVDWTIKLKRSKPIRISFDGKPILALQPSKGSNSILWT